MSVNSFDLLVFSSVYVAGRVTLKHVIRERSSLLFSLPLALESSDLVAILQRLQFYKDIARGKSCITLGEIANGWTFQISGGLEKKQQQLQ